MPPPKGGNGGGKVKQEGGLVRRLSASACYCLHSHI